MPQQLIPKTIDGMTKQILVFFVCLLGGFCITGISAQTLEVKGTVTDALKEPIPGANVLVRGTTVGTFTDIDGIKIISAIVMLVLLGISGFMLIKRKNTACFVMLPAPTFFLLFVLCFCYNKML